MASKTDQENGSSSPGQSSRERQGEPREHQQPQTSRLRQDEHQHQQHQHQYQHRILLPRWPPVPLVGSKNMAGFVQPPSVVGMPTASTMMEDHGPSGNVRSLSMMPTLTSMQQAVNAIAAASQGYGMVCGPGVHQAPVHPQWPPPGLLPGHPFNMAVELVAGAGDGVRPEPASGVSVESARGTGDDEPREASSKVVEANGVTSHAEDKASLPETMATSPENRDADAVRTPTRTRVPRFDNWKTRELREYASKLASWEDGKKVLRYGPGSDCVVRNISRAAQADLARAMRERAVHRMENNDFPEWEHWPPLTPEKDRKIGGKAVKKSPYLRKNESLVARMICIMASDDALFRLFVRSGQLSAHHESDRGATDTRHDFYLELAKALATIGWRNGEGKPVSVPRDHREDDPPAPSDLLDRLSRLDLEQPAYAAREVVEKDAAGKDDFTALQGIVHSWISSTRADHKVFQAHTIASSLDPEPRRARRRFLVAKQEMRDRQDTSGRAGADRGEAEKVITIDDDGDNEDAAAAAAAAGDADGDDRSGDDGEDKRGEGGRDRENGNVSKETRGQQGGQQGGKGSAQGAEADRKDSKHTWDFCRGRLSVLLWNDMITTMTGEDGVADVIPDIVHGSCGGVPGGTGSNGTIRKCEGKGKGRRSCEDLGEAQRDGGRAGQKRRKEKREVFTARSEALRTHPGDSGSDGRRSPTREELADDIKRLSRKIRESERENDPAVVIDTYRDLLSEKIKELHAKSSK